jgi:hypothetical protein
MLKHALHTDNGSLTACNIKRFSQLTLLIQFFGTSLPMLKWPNDKIHLLPVLHLLVYGLNQVSPSSLINTQTGYRLGNWAESPGSVVVSLFHCSEWRLGSVPSYQYNRGSFSWGRKVSWNMKLTTCIHLGQRIRMCDATISDLYKLPWHHTSAVEPHYRPSFK